MLFFWMIETCLEAILYSFLAFKRVKVEAFYDGFSNTWCILIFISMFIAASAPLIVMKAKKPKVNEVFSSLTENLRLKWFFSFFIIFRTLFLLAIVFISEHTWI